MMKTNYTNSQLASVMEPIQSFIYTNQSIIVDATSALLLIYVAVRSIQTGGVSLLVEVLRYILALGFVVAWLAIGIDLCGIQAQWLVIASSIGSYILGMLLLQLLFGLIRMCLPYYPPTVTDMVLGGILGVVRLVVLLVLLNAVAIEVSAQGFKVPQVILDANNPAVPLSGSGGPLPASGRAANMDQYRLGLTLTVYTYLMRFIPFRFPHQEIELAVSWIQDTMRTNSDNDKVSR